MKGKYSPTVVQSYQINENWFIENGGNSKTSLDKDGYDAFGYDTDNVDRSHISICEWFLKSHEEMSKIQSEWSLKDGSPHEFNVK